MDLLEQIKRDEGLRLKPYVDSVGKITIGYGTNLSDGIDQSEAEYLLSNRLNQSRLDLLKVLPWVANLDEVRRAVLFNMAYNVGVHGVLGFKQTLAYIMGGRWDEAAQEMLNSKWAKQVGARADRLAMQLRTGEWV